MAAEPSSAPRDEEDGSDDDSFLYASEPDISDENFEKAKNAMDIIRNVITGPFERST